MTRIGRINAPTPTRYIAHYEKKKRKIDRNEGENHVRNFSSFYQNRLSNDRAIRFAGKSGATKRLMRNIDSMAVRDSRCGIWALLSREIVPKSRVLFCQRPEEFERYFSARANENLEITSENSVISSGQVDPSFSSFSDWFTSKLCRSSMTFG